MAAQHLEQALDKFGCLFAFHGQLQSSFGPFATISALFVSACHSPSSQPPLHHFTLLPDKSSGKTSDEKEDGSYCYGWVQQ